MPRPALSRRARQIMDIVHRLGEATAADVQGALPDPPSYSAVRAHLAKLEEDGHLTHHKNGRRYVFRPTVAPETASRRALSHVVQTFFDGLPSRAVAALLDMARDDISDSDFERLTRQIDESRREDG